jgi:hypothetical protein
MSQQLLQDAAQQKTYIKFASFVSSESSDDDFLAFGTVVFDNARRQLGT